MLRVWGGPERPVPRPVVGERVGAVVAVPGMLAHLARASKACHSAGRSVNQAGQWLHSRDKCARMSSLALRAFLLASPKLCHTVCKNGHRDGFQNHMRGIALSTSKTRNSGPSCRGLGGHRGLCFVKYHSQLTTADDILVAHLYRLPWRDGCVVEAGAVGALQVLQEPAFGFRTADQAGMAT